MNTYGWKKVFKFTFIQTLKTKAFIISTIVISIIVMALGALINIIPALVAQNAPTDGSQNIELPFKKVFLVDETGVTTAESYKAAFDSLGLELNVTKPEQLESVREGIKTSADSVLVSMSRKAGSSVLIYVERPEGDKITQGYAEQFAAMMSNFYSSLRMKAVGLDDKNAAIVSEPVYTQNSIAGKEPVPEVINAIRSTVPMITSMLLFLMIYIYGTNIAQSIAQEKTSKVLELLLTSIRPLAVIIGKVLAMGLLSFSQFIGFALLGFSSFFITRPFAPMPQIPAGSISDAINQATASTDIVQIISKAIEGFTPVNIIIIIIMFIIGFLFYALIAGIFGAGISRMEDLQSAMQPYSLIGVAGFYLSFFPSSFGVISDTITTIELVSLYLPISSPFAIPSMLITGRINTTDAIIPILFLLICVILMAIFVSRVYEQVILHNGNRLKITDFFSMAKK